jgi:hypothetical protein
VIKERDAFKEAMIHVCSLLPDAAVVARSSASSSQLGVLRDFDTATTDCTTLFFSGSGKH